jgi:hypothetical protein
MAAVLPTRMMVSTKRLRIYVSRYSTYACGIIRQLQSVIHVGVNRGISLIASPFGMLRHVSAPGEARIPPIVWPRPIKLIPAIISPRTQ